MEVTVAKRKRKDQLGWEKHHNFEETVNMNNEYVPGEFEQLLFIGHFA